MFGLGLLGGQDMLSEAQPVITALRALHHDIGSVNAAKVFANAPGDIRLVWVALADKNYVPAFFAWS